MSGKERQQEWDNLDLVHDFVVRLQKYVPGRLGWIARQANRDSREWTDDYGFVVGDRFGSVNINKLLESNGNDGFVQLIAAEMLGYAPYSKSDYERRLEITEVEIARAESELNMWLHWRDKWQAKKEVIVEIMLSNGWLEKVRVREQKQTGEA